MPPALHNSHRLPGDAPEKAHGLSKRLARKADSHHPALIHIQPTTGGPKPGELRALQDEIAGCTRCPSLRPWRQFGRDAYGNARTGCLLVGEAPGRVSWENRRRFTGPAGLLLRRALRAVGHTRYRDLEDLFYMTDAVKCHPAPPGNLGANRSPRLAEVRACAAHLCRELEVLNPRVIVTFGKQAAEAVGRALAQSQNTDGWSPQLISFPHPSPRNQKTILKSYPSMGAFERAITRTFRRLIASREGRSR